MRAIDQAGNADQSADSFEWSIDTTAPDTQITLKPAALTNSASASFSFTGTDPGGSGVASFQCRRDSADPADWAACTSPQSYSSLADGAHSFEVRAIDQAGNADQSADSFEWTIDTAPPLVAIDSLSKSLLKAGESSEVSWHANENGAFSLRLGGSDCDSGTVLDSGAYGSQPASHISNVSAADLSEGANTLRLCLSDAAANRGADTELINKDTIAPNTTIDTKPAVLTNSANASFSFSRLRPGGSGVASFQCRRDRRRRCATCTSPTSYSSLADGAHSFEVRAIDQAGNADQSPDSFEWTIDTAAPPAPQLSATVPASPANDNTPQVVGSAPAGTTVRLFSGADCSGSPIATVTPAELEAGVEVSVADDSSTSFRATATTAAENASGCSEPLTYLEDSSSPQTQIDSSPSALTSSSNASFSFSGSDGGSGVASFQCRRDSSQPRRLGSVHHAAGIQLARRRRPQLRSPGDRSGRQRRPER